MLRFLLLIFIGSVSGWVYGFDCVDHFIVKHGESPILLTSPHGAGYDKYLYELPERSGFNIRQFVNKADQYTDEITLDIAKILAENGVKPYVVVAGIHRSQIDFNRPPELAYESQKSAPCYNFYHQQVGNAVKNIRLYWSAGFMLDVHGQSKYDYDLLRGTRNGQTIQQLKQRFQKDVTEEVDGFYYILRQKGYRFHPKAFKKERYYYGGYTVKTYGSHNDDGIDALQVEIGRSIRVDEARRGKISRDLAEALLVFYNAYYRSSTLTPNPE